MQKTITAVLLTIFAATSTAVQAQGNLPQGGSPRQPTTGQAPPPQQQQPGQPGRLQVNPGQPQQPSAGQANDQQAYRQQVSYALGRNFAQNLKQAEIDYDIQWLMAGVNDVQTSAKPKWTDEQLQAVLQRFEGEMQQKQNSRMEREGKKNADEAAAFLAQNAKQPGIQTTPSGLQFRVIKQGNGPSPTINDVVRCNYKGTLINGTEFDNSARHGGPAEFPVNRVIPGWTEALQKMHVGDKWQLYVPPKLAYDVNPPGPPIEASSLLVFEIELLEIVSK